MILLIINNHFKFKKKNIYQKNYVTQIVQLDLIAKFFKKFNKFSEILKIIAYLDIFRVEFTIHVIVMFKLS